MADGGWTLTAIYLAYALVSLPFLRSVWASLGADELVGIKPVLALFFIAFCAVALSAYLAPTTSATLSARLSNGIRCRTGLALSLLLALALIAPAVIASAVLDFFPNSGDEFAYFFQGGLFAKGELWAKAPPLGYTFVPYRTWIFGTKWLSQYPPGWPLMIAGALRAGLPAWSLNALIGAASAATLMSPLWGFKNRVTWFVVVALYVLTPFYLLNAASFHSHMVSALLVLLVCVCCLKYQRDRRAAALIACGALLGLIGLTRYYTFILVLPALCYWLFIENHGRRLRIVVALLLGGLPFLGLLMTYQYLVTGNPLQSTYALIANKDSFLSFTSRAVAVGVNLTAYRFEELGIWTSPIVVPVYLFCILSKLKSRSIAFYDLVFPAFVAGYVFFPDLGGNRYGPRYYFDSFPLMLVTIVSAAPHAAEWARRLWNRPLAVCAMQVSVIYILVELPFAFATYHRQVESREEPYHFASAQRLDKAVVVVETSSGDGFLAEDLVRNDEALKARILYARAGVTAGELRRALPGRSIWVYTRDDPESLARLESISSSTLDGTRLEPEKLP